MIKLAIPSKGNNVDNHFGHCDYFSIVELDDQKEIVNQFKMQTSKSCGCKTNLAEELSEQGVTFLLAGGIGQGAIAKLKTQNIEVLAGFHGTIEEAVKKWKSNDYLTHIPICVDHGHGDCSH